MSDAAPTINTLVRGIADYCGGEDALRSQCGEPRRITAGGDYLPSWWWWVFATSTAAIDEGNNRGYVVSQTLDRLKAHNSPTFTPDRDLVDALWHTDFGNAPMRDVSWGHDAMLFMLPQRCAIAEYHADMGVVQYEAKPIGVAIAKIWCRGEQEFGVCCITIDNHGGLWWTCLPMRDTWQEAMAEAQARSKDTPTLDALTVDGVDSRALTDVESSAMRGVCELAYKLVCSMTSETNGEASITSRGGERLRAAKRGKQELWSPITLSLRGGAASAGSPDANDPESHIRLHWRRGHFRQQPYGAGNVQRKTIWIRPYMAGRLQTP